MEQTIPVVDLRDYDDPAKRDAFVKTYGDALRSLGFVALEGYGIDDAFFAKVYDAYRRFFALPEDVKKKYENPEDGRRRGYTSFGIEHAKDNAKPDLKEFFHVGRALPADDPMAARLPKNVWPAMRPTVIRVFVESEGAAVWLAVRDEKGLGLGSWAAGTSVVKRSIK